MWPDLDGAGFFLGPGSAVFSPARCLRGPAPASPDWFEGEARAGEEYLPSKDGDRMVAMGLFDLITGPRDDWAGIFAARCLPL